jgi:hypothetical protein
MYLIKRLFSSITSPHKAMYTIPVTGCCREQLRFAFGVAQYNAIKASHPWCARFCKELCMRDAINDCSQAPPGFCEQNCHDECFYGGRTPVKAPVCKR